MTFVLSLLKNFRNYSALLVILAVFGLASCNKEKKEGLYSSDVESIHAGEALFTKNCSACHNFRLNGIGPNLAGVTRDTSKAWIKGFISNPQGYIEHKDPRALGLKADFKGVMPSFGQFSDDEMESLLAFLHTKVKRVIKNNYDTLTAIKNPFPDSIPMSDLRVDLEPVIQIPASSDKNLHTRITKFQSAPNGGFYILDLRGTLYRVDKNKAVPYFDIKKQTPAFIDEPGMATGFGSFAFHPEFKSNGLFYTTHTEPPKSKPADFTYADSIPSTLQWVLTEWKTDKPGAVPFSGTRREILRWDMVTQMHGVQEIMFNPYAKPKDEDYGLLYIGIGDAGAVEYGYLLAGNEHSYLGSIFRIDPLGTNSKNGRYGIPPTNPFAKDTSPATVKEIYAYGFRNPHRITWLKTGELVAGNVGQRNIESLYRVTAGKNHGWPIREGKFVIDAAGDINRVYPLPPNDSVNGLIYPVIEYDHDEGLAMAGGYEYKGKAIPAFAGKFILGDIAKGKIYIADVSKIREGKHVDIQRLHLRIGGKETTLLAVAGLGRVDMRLGQDAQGELYVTTKYDGRIYKMVHAEKVK
jgi:mono/diheme cytochrome c family protein